MPLIQLMRVFFINVQGLNFLVLNWCMVTYIVPTFIAHTLSMLLCYLVIYLPHSSGSFGGKTKTNGVLKWRQVKNKS